MHRWYASYEDKVQVLWEDEDDFDVQAQHDEWQEQVYVLRFDRILFSMFLNNAA